MTSGKYFNKGVKSLDSPDMGHAVRETPDKIIVFGGKDERYDIPISEVQQVGANVLIGRTLEEIVKRYKVSREEPLPTSRVDPWSSPSSRIDLGTYERQYPKTLFNKGVRAKDEDHVGHIMKETDDKIVVFGDSNYRFDIPKSRIIAVGMNVILGMDFPEIFKYQVDKNAPLPTGESVDKLKDEAYPEGYHGPKEYEDKSKLVYPKDDKQNQSHN